MSQNSPETERLADRIGKTYRKGAGPQAYSVGELSLDDLNLICASLRSYAVAQTPGGQSTAQLLVNLVDWTWIHATEGAHWPSAATTEALIRKARERGPTQEDAGRYIADSSTVCARCNGDQFVSGAWPDMPDEPCPVCNGGAPSGAERVRLAASQSSTDQPQPVAYQRRNIGPDGSPFSSWYLADDEPTKENMRFDGYLSYEYRPLYPGPAVPSTPCWPDGCRDGTSCARHKACMYVQCRHNDRSIAGEVEAALAVTSPVGWGGHLPGKIEP